MPTTILFVSLALAAPQPSQWLANQTYSHTPFLPETLSEEQVTRFQQQTKGSLNTLYQSINFSCRNNSRVLFPFQKDPMDELRKTYALETSACIPDITLQKAHDLYMSASFRTQYMPGVSKVTQDKEKLCVLSNSFVGIIKPAYFCITYHTYEIGSTILTYGFLADTSRESKYQPVYYQTEFIHFQQFESDVLIHRISINRSRELGSTGTYVLKKTAAAYPETLIKAMAKEKGTE